MPRRRVDDDDRDRREDRSRGRRRSTRRGSRRAPPPTTAATARRRRAPSAIAASPTASAAPVNAPKSWWPRNDTSRWPGRGPSGSSTIPRNISSAPAARGRRPGDEHDEEAVEVDRPAEQQHDRGREQRVLDELRRRDQVRARRLERAPEAREQRRARAARRRASQSVRPRRSGSQPNRTPAAIAAATSEQRSRVGAVHVDRPDRRRGPGSGRAGRSRGIAAAGDEREDVRCAQAGQGGATYTGFPDALPSHLATLGDGDRGLRRGRARLPDHGRRDPRARPPRLREVRRRDRRRRSSSSSCST